MTPAPVVDLPVRVRSLVREAEGVMSVELEALGEPLPAWTPGSHIDLVVPGAPVRQYSLCGDPVSPRYRIAVLREPESRGGSRAVHERVRPGDELVVRGPRNHFALEKADGYLFVAGGIGITPLLPMVRTAAAAGAPWRLLYLGASRRRMPFLDELAALGGDVCVIARDEGERADLPAEIAAHPGALIYACGPERMLSALAETVPDAEARLRVEYFTAPRIEYEPGGLFRIRLERAGVELDVEADESVLDVMRAAGVDVLSDCEEGICGSCETRVLDGEVEHRDFVLTPQERARSDCMMVCVSRAACPLLVLDA
ncbi:MAG: PDR/VanB family oxidoreductase [Microbacterium sp.]